MLYQTFGTDVVHYPLYLDTLSPVILLSHLLSFNSLHKYRNYQAL